MATEEIFDSVSTLSLVSFDVYQLVLTKYVINYLKQYEQEEEEQQQIVECSSSGGRKRMFSRELRCMMFGFGDDQNPYTESVDFLEDLVIEFITDMVSNLLLFVSV